MEEKAEDTDNENDPEDKDHVPYLDSNYISLRRCSSTGALNKHTDARALILQHPAILKLKSKGSHRKLRRQISMPLSESRSSNRMCSPDGSKTPSCLKNTNSTRKLICNSPDDETGSLLSTSRVNFSEYQESVYEDDLSDDVFVNIESEKETNCFRNKYGCPQFHRHIRESFMIILSGLYGILLVVVGLVLPLAETQIYPLYIFEVFYLYLFVTSMIFLFYVYVFLLHGANVGMSKLASQISLRFSKSKDSETPDHLQGLDSVSNCSKLRKRRIAFDQTSNHHTGSFYLRLGAMGFGIGSMILDGLYFGQYFDVPRTHSHCNDVMQAVKPAFKFFFTFSQLYFIFQNSKMRIFKYPSLARFGLIHMSATNICVWFRVIVAETLNSIAESNHFIAKEKQTHVINGISTHNDNLPNEQHNHSQTTQHVQKHSSIIHDIHGDFAKLPELSCYWSDSIGKILMAASPYLYPFCVEYSLICAAILYVMWQNVGQKEDEMDSQYLDEFDDGRHKRAHRMSVDCAGSSRGLFLGILFFIFGVVSTIAFYVLTNNGNSKTTADLLANLSETIVYLFAIVSIIVASVRMRTLKFKSSLKDRLEENLILISLTGLYMFGVFNLIAGFYYHDSIEGILTIVTNITMMTEATMQTIFMFATLRMSASHPYHAREKPGREFVTFLLLCNFAIWGITTFETRSIAHNSLQLKFYGSSSWSIFEHISVPLGIFYRFHSTVCLSHVWKNAWKRKKQIRDKM